MFSFTALCTVDSLILGVIALALSAVSILRAQKGNRWQRYSLLSVVLCTAALQLQLECSANWARSGDVPALLDCCGAQAFAGRLLLSAVILLNVVAVLAADTAAVPGRKKNEAE